MLTNVIEPSTKFDKDVCDGHVKPVGLGLNNRDNETLVKMLI